MLGYFYPVELGRDHKAISPCVRRWNYRMNEDYKTLRPEAKLVFDALQNRSILFEGLCPTGGGVNYCVCDAEYFFYVTGFTPQKVCNILAELREKRLIEPIQYAGSAPTPAATPVYAHQLGFACFYRPQLHEYWEARQTARQDKAADWWHANPHRYRQLWPWQVFRRRLTYRLGWNRPKPFPSTPFTIPLPRHEHEMHSAPNGAGVYLIKSVTGHYKIGRTADINNRLRTFGVKLPFEIELEHFIPTAHHRELERTLHARFASKRVGGEWFQLDTEDVASIKNIERM